MLRSLRQSRWERIGATPEVARRLARAGLGPISGSETVFTGDTVTPFEFNAAGVEFNGINLDNVMILDPQTGGDQSLGAVLDSLLPALGSDTFNPQSLSNLGVNSAGDLVRADNGAVVMSWAALADLNPVAASELLTWAPQPTPTAEETPQQTIQPDTGFALTQDASGQLFITDPAGLAFLVPVNTLALDVGGNIVDQTTGDVLIPRTIAQAAGVTTGTLPLFDPNNLMGEPSLTTSQLFVPLTAQQAGALTAAGMPASEAQMTGQAPLTENQFHTLTQLAPGAGGLSEDQKGFFGALKNMTPQDQAKLIQALSGAGFSGAQIAALLSGQPLPQGLGGMLASALGLAPQVGTALGGLLGGGAGLALGNVLANSGKTSISPVPIPETPGQASLTQLLSQSGPGNNLAGALSESLAGQQATASLLKNRAVNQALADVQELPQQNQIRQRSLAAILGEMPGTTPPDATTTGVKNVLLSALSGTENPELAREFARQIETLRNLGAIRGGPGGAPSFFSGSPGIEAATRLSESQNIQQYEDYLNTIKALGPLYTQRVTSDQNLENQRLTNRTSLARFGGADPNSMLSGFNTLVNIPNIISPAGQSVAGANAAQQNEFNLASFLAQRRQRQNLGSSLASLIGRATTAAL